MVTEEKVSWNAKGLFKWLKRARSGLEMISLDLVFNFKSVPLIWFWLGHRHHG